MEIINRIKRILALSIFGFGCFMAVFALPQLTHANTITSTVYIDNESNSVKYLDFNVSAAGIFSVDAFGRQTRGWSYNADPEIFIIDLVRMAVVGHDDDSGAGYDSHWTGVLGVGRYRLAVSEFQFSALEAIRRDNRGSVQTPGYIDLRISSLDGSADAVAVAEPTVLAFLAVALMGAFAVVAKPGV